MLYDNGNEQHQGILLISPIKYVIMQPSKNFLILLKSLLNR